MLGSMRTILDKYQKPLLVVLAALLISMFTLQDVIRPRREPDFTLGTIYGRAVTSSVVQALAQRWETLRLPAFGENYEDTYLLLLTARRWGIQVGSGAVAKLRDQYPPQLERIEYVIADPKKLADSVPVTDPEVKAHYEAKWKDKSQPFDKVAADVRRDLQTRLAKDVAARKIRDAHARVLALPPEGLPWREAFRDAANAFQLEYTHTNEGEAFSEKNAAHALPDLASDSPAGLRSEAPQLPSGFARILFKIEPGQPSPVLSSADKLFFFRVIETSAGFTPSGKLAPDDWGWRNRQFVVLASYRDQADLVRAKRHLELNDVTRTFEEYLMVTKLVALASGGTDSGALLTADAREQLANLTSEQVKALTAEIPVFPFRLNRRPEPDAIQDFYNARKSVQATPRDPNFGYYQPEKVQIEYVIADPARFLDQATVSDKDARDYYEANKSTKFLGSDGKTPKPFDEVAASIHRELSQDRAATIAEGLLIRLADRAQEKTGRWLPLDDPVREAGLELKSSRPFSVYDARTAVPELAEADRFISLAFSREYRPRVYQVSETERLAVRRTSPILRSRNKPFFFRLTDYQPPRVVEYSALAQEEQWQVERDCAHVLALQKAQDAARKLKTAIARQLVAAVAADNALAVHTDVVKSAVAPGTTTTLPPALTSYVNQKLVLLPGEIGRFFQDADLCYSIVITAVNRETNETTIEYVRFKPLEFKAVFRPPQQDVDERAEKIRDAELEKQKKDGKDIKDADKPKPTDKHVEQARAELLDEWKKKDLRSRYLEYLHQRLLQVFRQYIETNNLEIDRVVTLERETSRDFFHADDKYPLGGDKALIDAAFKLEPGKLSGVLAGETAAAILLLAPPTETRTEIKLEYVTIPPSQYDPLSVNVTPADAERYYKDHPEDFRRAAQARAEFLFASFRDIAARIKPTITDRDVTAYFERHRETAYRGQQLDERLKDTIRDLLAQRQAEDKDAEQAIRAAHALAAANTQPLATAAATLQPAVRLTAGSTHLLAPQDVTIERIGYAPALVKQILAAKKDALSEPVKTDDGWAIFRVTEQKESYVPDLKTILPAVRAKVRDRLLTDKARKLLDTIRAELAKDKSATIERLLNRTDIACQLPFRPYVATTGFIDYEHATPELTTALRKAAFNAKPGETTDIVESEEGVQLARVIDAKKDNKLIKTHSVLIPAELLAPTIPVSDDEAKSHYDANKQKFERPRRLELEYLVAETWKLRSELKPPTDAELRDAYEQLQHSFIDAEASKEGTTVYKTLDAVRDQVSAKWQSHHSRRMADDAVAKALAAIAKDKARPLKDVAADLKELRHVTSVEYVPGATDNPPELMNVNGLDGFLANAKEGDTSPALFTYSGPVIVRVKKVHPAHVPPLDEVKPKVKQDLARARGLIKAKEMAEKVLEKIKAPTPEAMQDAAAEFTIHTKQTERLEVRETPAFTRLEAGREMVARLFSLRPGEISEPPILAGERADGCFLATLVEARLAPTPDASLYLESYPPRVRAERYAQLVYAVRDQYRRSLPSP